MSSRFALRGHFAVYGNYIPEFPISSAAVCSPTIGRTRRVIGTRADKREGGVRRWRLIQESFQCFAKQELSGAAAVVTGMATFRPTRACSQTRHIHSEPDLRTRRERTLRS